MRNIRKSIVFLVIFILCSTKYVAADVDVTTETGPIIIDGTFQDWEGMPSVTDKSGDASKGAQDLKELKYYADEEFLYLYIERYEIGRMWEMWVPFPDVPGNTSIFYPWAHGNKDKENDWEWKSDTAKSFSLNAEYANGEMAVYVNLEGEKIDTFRWANSDGLAIEVKLPLEKVGLAGVGKEIKFSVASDISQWAPKYVDWISDEGPIIVTPGPIFGSLTPAIILSTFIGVGYIFKRKEE